jgi:succinate dehydrogenase / fumarate reductase, cytochrome b subunit
MKDRYAYYPGCLAALSAKELDTSTRAVCAKLDVELVDMPSFTCCGAGDIHEAKPDYYLHLNARILGQAEKLGCDTLLTICNVCTLNLRQANKKLLADPEELARVNRNLEQVGAATYSGGVEVRHLLWEVAEGDGYERFKSIADRALTGLKVAPFYGCQILRPSKILGFEDPDRPSSLENLIRACGAEPVDYPAKIKCCGFPIVLAREEVALGEAIMPLEQASEAGADVMVTPCPLCHLSLDAWQGKAERKAGKEFDLPILHLAQLLGAAAGIEEDQLKFRRHVVKVGTKARRILLGRPEPSSNGDAAPAPVSTSGH